jgi:hypothetical protein
MDRRKLPGDRKYYVYAFVRDSGVPYYIGRGCGYRHSDKTNRVIKPAADGKNVRIVKDMLSLEQANALEIALIDFWGRRCQDPTGVLRNMQDGGLGGSPGRVMSARQRKIMRLVHLGRKQDEEWIKSRTAHKKGRPHADEHAENLKEAIRASHRVHWSHEGLDIQFYGTSTELAERFSHLFYDYAVPGDRKLQKGRLLCRNELCRAWAGKRGPYKGWTRMDAAC